MAQAECISTAIRELMSRELPPQPTNQARAAHTELVAALASNPPYSIYVAVRVCNLHGRADHLQKVLAALHVYLSAILADPAQNIPGCALDHRYLDDFYMDFAADAVAAICIAAEDMREHETRRAS